MRQVLAALTVTVLAGCQATVSPELVQQYQARTLYTCCNIHYESSEVSDANYYVGGMVPLGTPVQVKSIGRGSATILAGSQELTLYHRYGTQQESLQQYLDKVLVSEDPKVKLSTYSRDAQQAINEGRVEVGMTKDQVILSLGYPATHRTASLSAGEWTYWYNHWITYRVQFDPNTSKVAQLIGTQLPSRNQPVKDDPPPVKAKPAAKAPAKKKR